MNEAGASNLVKLLAQAVDRPAVERPAYLDRICGGDWILRRQLELLLDAHDAAGSFMRESSPEAPTALEASQKQPFFERNRPGGDSHTSEAPGTIIGRYKLLQKIGEGGCGTVFMAEQSEPVRRRVALKVIKIGMDTKSVVARFEAERQALAMMDHPNIAKVLDAGATDTGRPYFVMELVRGIPITIFCDEGQQDTRQRLELFVQVCQAIQHAHQKGIIHRDIKPSNILVTMIDGAAVPKVIDFGIAKATQGPLTDHTLFTAFEQFIGTPAYMSPEQAERSSLDIDTRSDIYSLGVLLYELLTGKTPFDVQDLAKVGLEAIRRTIREVDPPRPSTRLSTLVGEALTTTARARRTEGVRLMNLIRGDLDWIVMKCLEKNRSRRYDTANGLAADLLRHLNDEPVIARPPSSVYRLGKAYRRHRTLFLSTGAVMLAILLGGIVSVAEAAWARRAEAAARLEAARKSQVTAFLVEMLESVNPRIAQRQPDPVLRDLLERASRRVSAALANQPDVAMELVRAIGRTYRALGQYDKAAAFQLDVDAAIQKLGRSRELDGALSKYELAVTRSKLGSYSEATNLFNEALRIARGSRARLVEAQIMREWAYVCLMTGQGTEAAKLATNSIAQLTALLGATDPETVAAQVRLAEIQYRSGQNSDVIATTRRILSGNGVGVSLDHPDALNARHMLAAALADLGRYGEAREQALLCVDGRRRVLGDEHPQTLAARDHLAVIDSYVGRYAAAEEISRSVVDAHIRQLGPEHDHTLAMKGNLAEYLRNLGRYTESEELFKEILATYQRLNPAGTFDLTETQTALAILYQFMKRHAEAEDLARSVLSERRQDAARPLPVSDSINCLNISLLAREKFREAESLSRESLELRKKNDPESWPRYVAEGQLGLSLAGLGRATEAQPFLESGYRHLTAVEASIPAIEKARIAEILQGLVEVNRTLGRPSDPASVAELALRQKRAQDHDRTEP